MKTKYERLQTLSAGRFKRLVGVKRETFEEMKGILEQAYASKHTRRGRKSKLSVAEMLLLSLEYWRQYTTFEEIGFEFGVCESTANNEV